MAEGRHTAEDLEKRDDDTEKQLQPSSLDTEDKTGEDKTDDDKSGITVDSVVDAFFASDVGGDGGVENNNASREGQDQAEHDNNDDKESRPQAPDTTTADSRTDKDSVARSQDAGSEDSDERKVSLSPNVDQIQALGDAGDGILERDSVKEETSSEQDQSLTTEQRIVDNNFNPSLSPTTEQRGDGNNFQAYDDNADDENADDENADDETADGNDADGKRNAIMEIDSFDGDIPYQPKGLSANNNHFSDDDDDDDTHNDHLEKREAEEQAAKQQQGDHDTGEEDERDVHLVAQGMVQQVMHRVMNAEADSREQEVMHRVMNAEADSREQEAGPQSEARPQFPGLDRVELNSEDWDADRQRGASSALDETSPPYTETDADNDQEKMLTDHDHGGDDNPETPEQAANISQERLQKDADEDNNQEKLLADSEQVAYVAEADTNQEQLSDLEDVGVDVNEGSVGEEVPGDAGETEMAGESQYVYQDHHVSDQAEDTESKATDQVPPASTSPTNNATTNDQTEPALSQGPTQAPGYLIQHQPPSTERGEGRRGEEESHDGSYLWLQRQVQWRAGSSVLMAGKNGRETTTSDSWKETSRSGFPHSRDDAGYSREERSLLRTRETTGSRPREDRGYSRSREDGALSRSREDGGLSRSRENNEFSGPADLSRSQGDISGVQSVSLDDRLGVTSRSGSAEASSSFTSPGAIPNYNTLRDQQVSWLSMYRMLEDQHRTQLQAQYAEHQQMITDMQRHLEGQLIDQQSSMRQKLENHREALRESSSASITDYSKPAGSPARYTQHSSPSHDIQPSPKSSPRGQETYAKGTRSSPRNVSQTVTRESVMSSVESRGERRLRGGVYSSPMPTARLRAGVRDSEEDSQPAYSSSESRVKRERQDVTADTDTSALPLSPRSHVSLREKHTKHLADLRAYYEAEIQDLRQQLTASTTEPPRLSSSSVASARESARERILQEENQMMRLQLRDLQDSLDDSHIHTRELEQKLHGLEIRAADYEQRYEESRSNVLKLKNRLEELHSYAKDRESVLEQTQVNERRQAAALQEIHKAKEELEESSRRDNNALKRLLEKYELLERDYNDLKETSAQFEQKLFDTRTETVHLNKQLSQLELENKRLTHDNDNMRHRLAVGSSLPLTRQELSERTQDRSQDRSQERSQDRGQERGRVSYEDRNGYYSNSRPFTHTDVHSTRMGTSRDTTPPRRPVSDDEDQDFNPADSPLLRAERELKRLQETMGRGEFVPRVQTKKYTPGTTIGSGPVSADVTIIDALSGTRGGSCSSSSVDAVTKEEVRRGRKTGSQVTKRDKASATHSKQSVRSPVKPSSAPSPAISSPTRFDVAVSPARSRSPVAAGVVRKGKAREEGKVLKSSQNTDNKQAVDVTLERVRSGEFVSRPQWEDVYTSLAKPPASTKQPALNMTQEDMLRDRIRSIDQVEKRYDFLQMEKRQLESQLNKVPAHGRDRKSRREKELLEEKLESVDHELGSVRMTLKRYQVLKTSM